MNAQNHFYRQYTIDDGLPTNYVYGATQDTLGNIWVYTENGVCLFDGYTFKTFTTDDGLPNNDVFWMVKDKTGKMWVLTLSWTLTYINENYEFVELDSFGSISVLHQLVDGKLFVSNNSTYFQLYGDNIDSFDKLIQNSKTMNYYSFQRDKHTFYLIDKEKKLKVNTRQFHSYAIEFDLNKEFLFNFGNTVSTGKFYFGGINNEMYFATDNSLRDARPYLFKNYFDKPVHVCSISHLNNKKIVLETDNGYLYLDSTYAPIKPFVGSKNGGLFQIPYYAKETEILDVPPESSRFLFKILETENSIYPVSKEGEIYRINNHKLKLVKQLNLSSDLIDAVPLNENEMWLAERKNAYIYQLNTNSVKPFVPKAKNVIYDLKQPNKTLNEVFLKGNRATAYNKSTNSIYSVSPDYVTKFDQITDSLYLLGEGGFSNVFVLGKNDIFFITGGSLFKEVNNHLKLLKKNLGLFNRYKKQRYLFV